MYGFLMTNKQNISEEMSDFEKIECGIYCFFYNKLNKFESDKLFFETEHNIFLLDGVIFNKKALMNMYHKNWKHTFIDLYRSNGLNFIDILRGSFSGIIYDKKAHSIEGFTNHSGEHPIYYCENGGELTVFSNIMLLKEAGWKYNIKPDIDSCIELLSVGGVLHGRTPYKGVFRLIAGTMLKFSNSTIILERYHKFTNYPETHLSMEECIEQADELFTQAIKRIYDKNIEYGYQNECDLSGGLDSRLAYFAALKLGYSNIMTICYSVENSFDHIISKKIAEDHNSEYIFFPMTGEILKDVDHKTNVTGGQIDYILFSGALNALGMIKDRNVGMTCMGLLGEISKAEYIRGDNHSIPEWCGNNRTSLQYNYPVKDKEIYQTYEELNLYERGLNIIVSSIIARQQMCEAYSPFIDPDFMDFVLRIPVKYRKNCNFEIEWIKRKYPDAARYLWQRTGKTVYMSTMNDIQNSTLSAYSIILRTINKAMKLLHISHRILSKFEMGPFEKWYINDQSIQEYMNKYYSDNIHRVNESDLLEYIRKLWGKNNPYSHIEVINLLSIYKNIITVNSIEDKRKTI